MVASALIYLGFKPLKDFVVVDAGDGPFLSAWLSEQLRPTDAQIAAAMLPAAKAQRIEQNRSECRARILARYPLEKQVSALAGVYPAEIAAAMNDWIAAHIAAENAAADAISVAETVAAVEAVTVAWPQEA